MTRLVKRFIANLFLGNRAVGNAMARTFGPEPAMMAKALDLSLNSLGLAFQHYSGNVDHIAITTSRNFRELLSMLFQAGSDFEARKTCSQAKSGFQKQSPGMIPEPTFDNNDNDMSMQ